jgi:hypothetical protein
MGREAVANFTVTREDQTKKAFSCSAKREYELAMASSTREEDDKQIRIQLRQDCMRDLLRAMSGDPPGGKS